MDLQAAKRKEGTYHTIQVVVVIGFILGLSMGFLDLSISLLSGRPFRLSSFSSLLLPLMATVSFFFLIYLILWLLVVSHLNRFLKLGTISLAVLLALMLALFFILTLLNNFTHVYSPPINLPKLSAMFLAYLLISVGAYFAAESITEAASYRTSAAFGFALPFVLAEIMLVMWLYAYRIDLFPSNSSFFALTGCFLIVLLTILLFHGIVRRVSISSLLTFFTVLVVLIPFMALAVIKGPRVLSEAFKDEDRRVRHVVLLTVDTLRADVLSCYGSERSVSTPNIDRLAQDGVLFTNAISAAPWTLPSFSSIMTGLSPMVHMTTKYSSKLPDNLTTLAEYMHDDGYYAAAIVYNPFLGPRFNLSQGFLEYNSFPRSPMGKSFGVSLLKYLSPEQLRVTASTRDITRLAVNWLQSNRSEDFFLWVHYYDPHVPYAPPHRFLPKEKPPKGRGKRFNIKEQGLRDGRYTPSLAEREWIKKLYDGEVRYVDENIGKLISMLKRLKIYDESLIIFTSDHGEEFWDHGGYEHGHTLYNELLHVPLIIKLPSSAKRGEVSTSVSTQSIMPTVLELTEIERKDDYLFSDSLAQLWGANPDNFNEQPIISTGLLYFEDRESVIFDGIKYIRFLVTDKEELYDLTHDPGEQVSILSSSPEKVDRAKSILLGYKKLAMRLANHYSATGTEKVELDKETTEVLKSLGYLQ